MKRGANGEREVFAARRRLGLNAVLAVGLTVVSLWVLIWATPTTFCGIATVLLFVRAFSHRPLVVVSEDGILDNESMFQLPVVRWDEVAGVDIEDELGDRHLRVRLDDPEAVISRCRSPISRAVYAWGVRNDRPVVSVSPGSPSRSSSA